MNENIEKLKKNLISNTVNQSLQIVDKQMEKRVQSSQCKEVHIGFTCSACSITPIVGFRYTCGVFNDFNLCELCENLIGDTHPYPLLKIRNTVQGAMKIKFMVEPKKNDDKKTNFK